MIPRLSAKFVVNVEDSRHPTEHVTQTCALYDEVETGESVFSFNCMHQGQNEAEGHVIKVALPGSGPLSLCTVNLYGGPAGTRGHHETFIKFK